MGYQVRPQVRPPWDRVGDLPLDCPMGKEFAIQLPQVREFSILVINPIQARGSVDPQRFLSITLGAFELMYQSIPSLTIPPGNPRGFAHSCCPWGRVFAPPSCPGGLKSK